MEIDYIFLEKDKRTKNKNSKREDNYNITPFYKKLFLDVAIKNTLTANKFNVEYNNENFEIQYNYTCNDNGEHFLKIEIIKNDNLKIAKVLNYINENIKKSILHQDYYIIQTYDESSKYLCDKIYPKFNEFERKIRRLIYLILIKAFGKLWVQETINDELKNKLKNKLNSTDAMIEKALQEMDINDLEDFLFKPRYWYNIEEVIDNELSIKNIGTLEKDEIIKHLEKIQKYRLWDKCFSEIKITKLEEKLERIRKLRNEVAHFKEISLKQYAESQILLKSITKEIDTAIINISLKNYDLSISKDILISFSEMSKKIKESLSALLEPISFDFVSEAIKSMFEQIEQTKLELPEGLFPKLENPFTNKSINEMTGIKHMIDEISKPINGFKVFNMGFNSLSLPLKIKNPNKQIKSNSTGYKRNKQNKH